MGLIVFFSLLAILLLIYQAMLSYEQRTRRENRPREKLKTHDDGDDSASPT